MLPSYFPCKRCQYLACFRSKLLSQPVELVGCRVTNSPPPPPPDRRTDSLHEKSPSARQRQLHPPPRAHPLVPRDSEAAWPPRDCRTPLPRAAASLLAA